MSESIARDPSQSADVGEAMLALATIRGAHEDQTASAAYAERAVEALSTALGPDHRLTRSARAAIGARRE